MAGQMECFLILDYSDHISKIKNTIFFVFKKEKYKPGFYNETLSQNKIQCFLKEKGKMYTKTTGRSGESNCILDYVIVLQIFLVLS